jgi:hypothetical protein
MDSNERAGFRIDKVWFGAIYGVARAWLGRR